MVLPRDSQGLYLLQRVRDEAHRFAISYHRQLRRRAGTHSQLDDVPGIGPKRRRALLKEAHYNAFSLKAELGKDAFGDGHGH